MKLCSKKLKVYMAKNCINTKELQERASIPRATINNAITGRGVSPKTAGIIAKALGCDVEQIIEN